jgi:hypothetical protein
MYTFWNAQNLKIPNLKKVQISKVFKKANGGKENFMEKMIQRKKTK